MSLLPEINKSIQAIQTELCDLATNVHANPELGYQEKKACAWQVELLEKWGFIVETPYGGLDTAFYAEIGSGEPTFAVLSEYDALPRLGHACGHNLICAASLGAGKSIADYLTKTNTPGKVIIMGTPAEEGFGGKVELVKQNCFDKIDAAIMAHPSSVTMIWNDCLSVIHYEINYKGVAAHSGGCPEKGKNALDAVMLLFAGVNAWRQHIHEDARVHGIVTEGGDAPNIVPEKASCSFYVRANDIETMKIMRKRFEKIVEAAAMMTETEVEIKNKGGYMPGLPNKIMNDAYHQITEEMGMNPIIPKRSGRGSTDFSDVSQVIPGVHVYFKICDSNVAGHSKEFTDAAGSDFAKGQMLKAAEALGNIGVRFFTDADFRRRIIEEKENSVK